MFAGDECTFSGGTPFCGAVGGDDGEDPSLTNERRDRLEMLAELPDLWDININNYYQEMGVSRFIKEGSLEEHMSFVKSVTTKPVVTVGRFTSPDTMASQIKRGIVDFIGAARPSIADPFLPKKIEEVLGQDEVKKEKLLNKELRRQAKAFDEEEATPTAADETPVMKPNPTQEADEESVEEDDRQEDAYDWEKVAAEARAKLSIREPLRKLDQAEAEVIQPTRRRLEALMRLVSTTPCISEEPTYRKYKLDKYEDAWNNLVQSFEDDEKAQGQAQDVNSLMELLVAGEQMLPDPHEEAHMRNLYCDSEFLDDVNRLEPLD